ncbi:MAG: HD domain-containing phosphohydrolase [Spirochaetia bacterium]|jgi:PAS domain S-box-containing protein
MKGPVVTEVLLKIIEEFTDGFLIVNEDGKIVFFNDVLLKTIGLHSTDIFSREKELLKDLGIVGRTQPSEREILIEDRNGTPQRFIVSTLSVEGTRDYYTLARVTSAAPGAKGNGSAYRRELAQLFRNIGDPIISADLSGAITLANPSFYQLVGWDEGEELPNIASLYAHAPELDDKILRLAESDMVYNLETHVFTKTRQLRRVLDTSWVVRDEHGVVQGYTTHFKDVTYVKNLEARLKISERNYMVLFDTILSSIIIIDPFGKILNCNYYAEKMYGCRRDDIVTRDFNEVFEVHKKSLPIQQVIALVDRNRGRYVETDVPRRCVDGTIKFTYASYSALTSTTGETIAYSIMERDLTERVRLEKKLQDSFQQIKDTQSAAILGFARLTEYRDMDTGKHLERIREYTRVLAIGLGKLPKYADYITAEYVEDLCLSSVLHDVGKVGIEDAVLLKPGRLDTLEYEKIKRHAQLGGEALRKVDQEIKRESFLTIGKEVAFSHHERWDGAGYPAGRKGEQIPLSARIVALADVYDALTSKRSYKKELPHEEAVKIIMSEKGTHFDPDIVDVFEQNLDTFRRIQMLESFKEHPESIDDILKSGKS